MDHAVKNSPLVLDHIVDIPHLISTGTPAPSGEYPDDVGPRRQLVGIAGVKLAVELCRLEHLEADEEAQ